MKQQKPYIIQKVNDLSFLVISKDYSRVDEILPELSMDLKKKKARGDIVFDLLLSNGNNSSRFFTIFFNGENFEIITLKKIPRPSTPILNKVNAYLKLNKELLKNSVLTTAEVQRLLTTL